MIDLTEIMTNFKESIDLDNEYDLSSTITSGDILDLSKITLKGKIEKEEDGIYIKANVEGKMKIRDSVTLDEVWYPFSFEIDENLDETLKMVKIVLILLNFYGKILYWKSPLDIQLLKILTNIRVKAGSWLVKKNYTKIILLVHY